MAAAFLPELPTHVSRKPPGHVMHSLTLVIILGGGGSEFDGEGGWAFVQASCAMIHARSFGFDFTIIFIAKHRPGKITDSRKIFRWILTMSLAVPFDQLMPAVLQAHFDRLL